MDKFYITTPIYYVNASPHIGHSYTTIAADAISRFMRLKGREVFFLTGTDEHGQKILRAAEKEKIGAQEFVDKVVVHYRELWKLLDISYDDFIRTTEIRHKNAVRSIIQTLYDKGDIYLAEYSGWYCTPCEIFWTETQLEKPVCPDCSRPLEELKEKNYFFRMEKYRPWLVEHVRNNSAFIKPASRRNEILKFLENPLNDLCISRPKSRLSWGIPLPIDENYVTYVWFDALTNYISALGFGGADAKFKRFWPADVHFVGKDILRQHAVYWPIMLHALGLETPKTVFAHGWWMIGENKMSKSRGNIVDPIEMVKTYGRDAYRYFVLREISFGLDGNFSEDLLINRINSDLANDLGNLYFRTLTMVEKYFSGKIPPVADMDAVFKEKINKLPVQLDKAAEDFNFQDMLVAIWELINIANKYIEDSKPWEIYKRGDIKRLEGFSYNLLEVLRIISVLIYPFMPTCASSAWKQLGQAGPIERLNFKDVFTWGLSLPGTEIKKGTPLFPRIET